MGAAHPVDRGSRPIAVSLIIPCHNEETGLPHLHDRLTAALPGLENAGRFHVDVLLFDNGSTDATLARMREFFGGSSWATIYAHPENVGIGGSLRVGLPLTRGDIVVHLDSDCTYDPAEIAPLLGALEEGWDVATGSPYHPRGSVVGVPAWRLTLSRGLSHLYRRLTPVHLWTYTSMFRAYRRRVLESIHWTSDGFLSTSEILLEAAAGGFTIYEHPTTLSVRRFGASKIRLFRVVRDHLGYLLGLVTDREFRRRLATNYRVAPEAPPVSLDPQSTQRSMP